MAAIHINAGPGDPQTSPRPFPPGFRFLSFTLSPSRLLASLSEIIPLPVEFGKSLVFARDDRIRNFPVNCKHRIVVQYPTLILARVVIVDPIDHFCFFRESGITVCKPFWNVEHFFILFRQHDPKPLPERIGFPSQVDDYIEDFTRNAPYEFGLLRGIDLKMEASYHPFCGLRVIILYEFLFNADLLKFVRPVRLHEEPALIVEDIWRYYDNTLGRLNVCKCKSHVSSFLISNFGCRIWS